MKLQIFDCWLWPLLVQQRLFSQLYLSIVVLATKVSRWYLYPPPNTGQTLECHPNLPFFWVFFYHQLNQSNYSFGMLWLSRLHIVLNFLSLIWRQSIIFYHPYLALGRLAQFGYYSEFTVSLCRVMEDCTMLKKECDYFLPCQPPAAISAVTLSLPNQLNAKNIQHWSGYEPEGWLNTDSTALKLDVFIYLFKI